jgi:hypothetical protein
MPSTPLLWSAGKWGEWYPDAIDETGRTSTQMSKPAWEEGWEAQHNRLVLASAVHGERPAVWISGDLHATAIGRITRLREFDMSENPVTSVLVGTLGTGPTGWPSVYRRAIPQPSNILTAEEILSPLEENGFSLIDILPEEIRIAQFRWRPADGVDAIARLTPFVEHRVVR